ncbi:RluA family pseudouridine synthase [Gracilibacillus caseinilyticus]|uniref:Pseudouridine synthase n=1 Tax=Gracilibacillus caseinilyticus TaxID=2932256 RepID=A0ABY4EWY0_9BACI|nr:RluA family pseudouridine synthase [Gracilibacillus caseinilyticus]UOQ48342.1 RluA family pseudouridine synthase [Gracilibacillus caseinilyticus]
MTKQFNIESKTELLPFLIENMENKSRNAVKSILKRGQVYVNDQSITQHNYLLQPGATVSIQSNAVHKATSFDNMKLLYEDASLIVIDKASGLLSIATEKEKQMTAYKQLTQYVKTKDKQNRIFIVHRLDRDTSGVMVFAKSEKVKQQLQNNWKSLVVERTYVALVEGKVQSPKDTITSWLKESSGFKMYSSHKPGDGKEAITTYQLLKTGQEKSLVSIQLQTGRKNQIRVHMSDIGHPIVGDKKYGANINTIGRLGLHAQVLQLIHPITKKRLRFESPIPKEFKV